MNEPIKTTKEDFEIFKTECKKWIDYFGLYGWETTYKHEVFEEEYMADCAFSPHIRAAIIRLNAERPGGPNMIESNVKRSAFHEVCELFLGKLTFMAEARFLADGEIEEETHNIIRILENRLFTGGRLE